MSELKTVSVNIQIPKEYKPAPGEQPREVKRGEYYLLDIGHSFEIRKSGGYLEGRYIILEPDPTYIDTTTIEYRVEVYRQWLLGRTIEVNYGVNSDWKLATEPRWLWKSHNTYRVQPTHQDKNSNYYYEDGREKVYVPN